MKKTFVETDCRDKIAPNCTQTFMREVKRGRPQVNCDACKTYSKPKVSLTGTVVNELGKGQCPCGNVFDINPGRGRKPTKCNDCRAAGTVYRENEDGEIEAIRAAALAEEQREKAEEAGRIRAEALFQRMQPLLRRTDRQVITR